MTDLAILVPSRGRPASVARLVEACEKTCRTDALLHFGFDEDDPECSASIDAQALGHPMCDWTRAARMTLTGWTNLLAFANPDVPYLASLGDDHLPETDGWDEQLITAIEHQGGGYAYPNDHRTAEIPESVVADTRVVRALGWFANPAMTHWYIDNTWRDLGHPDLLTYCPQVHVRHLHPNVTGQPGDRTYGDAAAHFNADLAAYQRWRITSMARDRETVRAACR